MDQILNLVQGNIVFLILGIISIIIAMKVVSSIIKLISVVVGLLFLAIQLFGHDWVVNLISQGSHLFFK